MKTLGKLQLVKEIIIQPPNKLIAIDLDKQ